MLFTTDKQTLEDLNIFGRHGGDAIYHIFNRCSTRGGAALLEDMFRYPLSDAAAINKRSSIIQCFAQTALPFPFSSALFDSAATYMAVTDERTQLSAHTHSLGRKIGQLVAADADTQQLYRGVQALVAIIRQTKQFINGLSSRQSTCEAFQDDQKAIAGIIAHAALAPVGSSLQKPSQAMMAEWDILFRFRHRDLVQQLLQYLYRLDVYIAVATVARDRNFAFPVALPGAAQLLNIRGVYHPQLKKAVPNTIACAPGGNLVFLTGANMAGKSTFMKSVSIAVFLAHMGFPVPAAAMEFAVFDGVYTTINLPDNLGMGASHFYAEVIRVKKITTELGQGKRLFVVFDELFRGTNVKDAYEATIAIAGGFALRQNSVFILSTHIIEAADPLAEICRGILFRYLPTEMNGHIPVYTYRLKEGVTADRHGMIIINNEGILDRLHAGNTKKSAPDVPANGPSHTKAFVADKQTTDDLNLLGKFRAHSIFSLFNKVVSPGGERLLEEMFRHPMTDQEAINHRSRLFRYFQEKTYALPVTRPMLDQVENYLSIAGIGNWLIASTGILRKQVAKLLLRDQQFDQWKAGLSATIEMLHHVSQFLSQLTDYPFPEELETLRRWLADDRMAWLRDARHTAQWSLQQLLQYHHLLSYVFRREVEALLNTIYHTDVYIAVAKVAREKGWGYAHALPKEAAVLDAPAVWHPALEKPVANALSFTQQENLLFLTGANMAGKSTLMKSLGIAIYLAHMGFPVAAANMRFSVMDGLYCSINVPDSLALGYSHFYAEVLRVKKVAEEVAAGKRLFVIFDELFKGTNVKDAYDATLACTTAFAAYRHCFYVVSTHIIEVGEALQQATSGTQYAYMPTVMNGSKPQYTYRLTSGITNDRQGMTIIENEGIIAQLTI